MMIAMRWLALAVVLGLAPRASAQATLITGLGGPAGYGTNMLAHGDSVSSAAIDLTPAFPMGVDFYGAHYTTAFVNTNGSVTFGGAEPTSEGGAFFPNHLPHDTIGAWSANADTTTAGGGTVYWDVRAGQFTATWDHVGYAAGSIDRLNAFQIVITQMGGLPAGTIQVEMRFNQCQWDRGMGDFEGALVGMGNAAMTQWFAIPTSGTRMITTTACMGSNVGSTGVWRFGATSVMSVCGNRSWEVGEECDDTSPSCAGCRRAMLDASVDAAFGNLDGSRDADAGDLDGGGGSGMDGGGGRMDGGGGGDGGGGRRDGSHGGGGGLDAYGGGCSALRGSGGASRRASVASVLAVALAALARRRRARR